MQTCASRTPHKIFTGHVEGKCMYLISTSTEREKPYNFFRAKQQNANFIFYSQTRYDFRVNRCDWCILADNEKRIVQDCLTARLNKNNCFKNLEFYPSTDVHAIYLSRVWLLFWANSTTNLLLSTTP